MFKRSGLRSVLSPGSAHSRWKLESVESDFVAPSSRSDVISFREEILNFKKI